MPLNVEPPAPAGPPEPAATSEGGSGRPLAVFLVAAAVALVGTIVFALVHAGNERIYSPEALRSALDQVSPGGTLAIWAAQPEPELLTALQPLGTTEEVLLDVEREGRTLTYALYLTRP